VFSEGHPQVHLTSHVLAPTDAIAAVQNGTIDLAFLRLATEAAGVRIEPILKEPLVVAMSDSHSLSSRKVLPLEALADELCILRARHVDPAFHDFVLAIIKESGVPIKIAYEHSSVYTTLGMIAAGLAVSLVPASILQLPIKHLIYRHLKPPQRYVEIEMAYKPDNKSAVLAEFLDVVRKVCREWHSPSRIVSMRRERAFAENS
jgi:DNA-binding transcriptional LysR family regulator